MQNDSTISDNNRSSAGIRRGRLFDPVTTDWRHRGAVSAHDPRSEQNAFTIKGTGKTYPTFEETVKAINTIATRLSERGKFIGYPIFEFDSKHRIHAHGTILSHKSLYHPHYRMKGWHIHFHKLENDIEKERWNNYLKKSRVCKSLCQQYDIELYYKYNNGFLESGLSEVHRDLN